MLLWKIIRFALYLKMIGVFKQGY